jgi:secreted trypsin-like serine protease
MERKTSIHLVTLLLLLANPFLERNFFAQANTFSTWYMNRNFIIPSQDSSATNIAATTSPEKLHHKEDEVESVAATGGRYPYVAYIYWDEDGAVWRCGGTLIAQDLVLTAAHCLPKSDSFLGTVTLGGYESYNNEPQVNYRIASIVRHPEYSGWTGYPNNDFAIVQLDRCSGVSPVTLNQPGQLQLVDKELYTVLGWEDTLDAEGYEIYTTIQESMVYLDQSCEPWRSRTTLGTMTDNMMCTSSLPTDESLSRHNTTKATTIPKQGDSGGALLLKGTHPKDDIQIGVISFGYDKPGRKKPVPTVYGKVESSYSWIFIASNSLSQCL